MALQNEFFVGQAGGAASPTLLGTPRGTTAGGVYMAQLGDYQFALETAAFRELQRHTEYRWASLPRIGRAPAHQFLGLGDETIELQGTIYPHFRGGIGQLSLMRAQAGRGEPLALTYAFERVGQYAGRWCIASVQEQRSEFFRDGRPRKVDFQLRLQAYGEDEGTQDAVVQLIQAVTSAIPATAMQPPALAGDGGAALTASAAAAAAVQPVVPASPVSDVHAAASVIDQIAAAAAKLAKLASTRIEDAASSLQGAVLAVIPSDSARVLIQSAAELVQTANRITGMASDVNAEIGVLRDFPAEMKRVAASGGQQLDELRTEVLRVGASVKGVAATLSAMTNGAASDRLAAAAAATSVARSSDQLLFATTEGVRQMGVIDGKITV